MSSIKPKRVVIVGAGPAGLLAAIQLLRRNTASQKKYQVTLIDPGVDYGKLDEEGLKRFRSWMIGLSSHGLDAVKTVPGLYEDYISKLGVQISGATFGIGSLFKFTSKVTEEDDAFTVDRNYICGALAKYLNDNFVEPSFVSHYETTALYVDPATKTVIVRSTKEGAKLDTLAIEYDMILGCDGIRSVVRNAFITNHREFEFDLHGSFGVGKSIHITCPKNVDPGEFMLLANCVPNVTAFVLPERGGMLNFACGYTENKPCHDDLYSDDPVVVGEYFRKHFTAFDMDYEEFGREWVKQSWSDTQMVHCNFYHSAKIQALLLGDAAHATVPNIGMGMNTALEDAVVLNSLLDEHGDDWTKVLPAFSELRVKEGNALTDLSFHTFSLDPSMQMNIMLRQNIHRLLNKILPYWLLGAEPMNEINDGVKLSEAYDKMMQLGYLQKSRRINTEMMQAHFERKCGMVKERKSSFFPVKATVLVVGVAVGVLYFRGTK